MAWKQGIVGGSWALWYQKEWYNHFHGFRVDEYTKTNTSRNKNLVKTQKLYIVLTGTSKPVLVEAENLNYNNQT